VSLWPIEPVEWWVETAERRSRRLIALASDLSRLDQRVRDEYVDHVSDWLLTERIARRALNSAADPLRKDLLARLDEAGLSLFETIESLELTDVQERVLSRNGEAEDRTGTKSRTSVGESARIRQIGRPLCFRSNATNEAGLPVVVLEPVPANSRSMSLEFWIAVGGIVLLPAFASLLTWAGPAFAVRLTIATLVGLMIWTLIDPIPGLALGLGALLGRGSAREP
jgi:hypothetical protein